MIQFSSYCIKHLFAEHHFIFLPDEAMHFAAQDLVN
jgi:hypothetical protein